MAPCKLRFWVIIRLPLNSWYNHRLEDARNVTAKPAIGHGVVQGVADLPKDEVGETVDEEEEEEEEDSESVCILPKHRLMLSLIHSK
jgi:hypothetical protein